MNATDLVALGDAFARSPAEFDILVSKHLAAAPGRKELVLGKGKSVYIVERVGNDVGRGTETLDDLAALVQIAGLGPEMGKLRKLHERQPPADKNWCVPSEPWVARHEALLEHSPLTQAQACLRAMTPNVQVKPWAISLVRTKLARLLLEYPAMLHPRLVWDFESRKLSGRISEPLPMVNAMAIVANASLPFPYLGFGAKELKAFATHPLVAYALRAKSPVLDDRSGKRELQGQTLVKQLSALSTPRFMLGHALLHIDRLRAEAGCGAPLFAGTELGRQAMSNLLAHNFAAAWRRPLVSKAVPAFLEELKLSPTHPAGSLGVNFLRSAPSIFFDARTLTSVSAGTSVMAAADQVERFDRLVEQLVSTGALQTQKMAAYAVLQELFPTRHESGTFSTGPTYATVEVAHALFGRWLDQGVGLEELGERIRFSQRGSVWEQALETLETERAMAAAINSDSAAASESREAPVALTRRNRAV